MCFMIQSSGSAGSPRQSPTSNLIGCHETHLTGVTEQHNPLSIWRRFGPPRDHNFSKDSDGNGVRRCWYCCMAKQRRDIFHRLFQCPWYISQQRNRPQIRPFSGFRAPGSLNQIGIQSGYISRIQNNFTSRPPAAISNSQANVRQNSVPVTPLFDNKSEHVVTDSGRYQNLPLIPQYFSPDLFQPSCI